VGAHDRLLTTPPPHYTRYDHQLPALAARLLRSPVVFAAGTAGLRTTALPTPPAPPRLPTTLTPCHATFTACHYRVGHGPWLPHPSRSITTFNYLTLTPPFGRLGSFYRWCPFGSPAPGGTVIWTVSVVVTVWGRRVFRLRRFLIAHLRAVTTTTVRPPAGAYVSPALVLDPTRAFWVGWLLFRSDDISFRGV